MEKKKIIGKIILIIVFLTLLILCFVPCVKHSIALPSVNAETGEKFIRRSVTYKIPFEILVLSNNSDIMTISFFLVYLVFLVTAIISCIVSFFIKKKQLKYIIASSAYISFCLSIVIAIFSVVFLGFY